MGVLIIVVPAPNAKVKINNIVGVTNFNIVIIPNAADIADIYTKAIKSIFLRSKISDNIPEGNANRKIGNVVAVVIRDTNKGFGTRDVINQDAPTSYIAAPTYEKRAEIHNVLYRANLKGLKPDELLFSSGGCTSLSPMAINDK